MRWLPGEIHWIYTDTKSNEEWSSQLWSQFLQLCKEAWKKFRTSTGLEPVTSRYRCDALPTELWSHWRWEQVNFGFICSRERYEGEWCIWNKSYVNCRYEIKWRMILAVHIWEFHLSLIQWMCVLSFETIKWNVQQYKNWQNRTISEVVLNLSVVVWLTLVV